MQKLIIIMLLIVVGLSTAFAADMYTFYKKQEIKGGTNYTPVEQHQEVIGESIAISTPKQDKNKLRGQIEAFLKRYGSPWGSKEIDAFMSTSCKPEFLVSIACREGSCGKNLTTTHNPGNVGNNDRGDRVHFDTFEQGVNAMCNTLNNNFLKHKTQLWELSGIRCQERTGHRCDYWYATSKSWVNDTAWFITKITGEKVDENYLFRNS